jgi:hypothetical protein
MTYDFKKAQELAWFAFVTVLTQALIILATTDLSAITDWRAWAVATGAGLARAVAAQVLTKITPSP